MAATLSAAPPSTCVQYKTVCGAAFEVLAGQKTIRRVPC